MINYKIIDTTVSHFLGIEIPFDFTGYSIGDTVEVLGLSLKVQQTGLVTTLASKDNIFVFQQTNP